MTISILRLALDDLQQIHERLSGFGDVPPKVFRESFEGFIRNISANPLMYSQYPYDPDYRRAVIAYDHLVFYRVDNEAIRVYRVLHSKRNVIPLLANNGVD